MMKFAPLVVLPLVGIVLVGCGKEQPSAKTANPTVAATSQPATDGAKPVTLGTHSDKALRARLSPERRVSFDNLLQLALAIHTYADANDGSLPPGQGETSWRVDLLPYIEQQNLWTAILNKKIDEKELAARMPKTFTAPGHSKEPGMTHYQIFSGKKTAFPKDPLTLGIITAGKNSTANTLLIVETADAVPWTSNTNLSVQEGKPLPKFFPGSFLAAFADGHVELIPATAKDDVIRMMIDPDNPTPIKRSW